MSGRDEGFTAFLFKVVTAAVAMGWGWGREIVQGIELHQPGM
jgi:hypothetical protein